MKKRFLGVFFIVLILSGCTDYAVSQTYVAPVQKQVVPIERSVSNEKVEVKKIQPVPVKETADVPLSNNNHYINSVGNEVHSPAFAPSIPAGASAICRDGEYSFSQSRRGTCSRHGGVAEWL